MTVESLDAKAPRGNSNVERTSAGLSLVSRACASGLLVLIRIYQLMISPFFGASCRFEPSCSRYAASCIRQQGPLRGLWLTTCRLCRCHPFCEGGYDPPPSSSPGGQL